MSKRKPLTDADGEVRELTAEDFKAAVPFSALPKSLQNRLATRGPQKRPTKVSTTIRFDADLLEVLKAHGDGWQTEVNKVLRREMMGKS